MITVESCEVMSRLLLSQSPFATVVTFVSISVLVYHTFLETHLACHSVRAKFAKAQRRLDPPQKGYHIKVLYPAPDKHMHSNERPYTTRNDML